MFGFGGGTNRQDSLFWLGELERAGGEDFPFGYDGRKDMHAKNGFSKIKPCAPICNLRHVEAPIRKAWDMSSLRGDHEAERYDELQAWLQKTVQRSSYVHGRLGVAVQHDN